MTAPWARAGEHLLAWRSIRAHHRRNEAVCRTLPLGSDDSSAQRSRLAARCSRLRVRQLFDERSGRQRARRWNSNAARARGEQVPIALAGTGARGGAFILLRPGSRRPASQVRGSSPLRDAAPRCGLPGMPGRLLQPPGVGRGFLRELRSICPPAFACAKLLSIVPMKGRGATGPRRSVSVAARFSRSRRPLAVVSLGP